MKTSLKDVIKINKKTGIQFFKLLDVFISELKTYVYNKKMSNELCLHYIVPPFRVGCVVYSREIMYDHIFDRIKDKFDIVKKLPMFKIYIGWKPKPKKDHVAPILAQLDKLVLSAAKRNRQECTYTFSDLCSIHECNRVMQVVKKEVKKKGFDVETMGNKMKILWNITSTPLTHEDLQPISTKRPTILNCDMKDLPKDVKLNRFNVVMPIDTRRNKSHVVGDFIRESKKYDIHGVTGVKSFPTSLSTNKKKHTMSRRTILESNDMIKRIQELSEMNIK
jgi:hypothetical protein